MGVFVDVAVEVGTVVAVDEAVAVLVEVGRGVRVGDDVHVGIGVFVDVAVKVGREVDVAEGVNVAVEVNVLVAVDVLVEVGRGVRVGEAVHVGGGVRVGVLVQMIGVRVIVGVADNAARNASIRAVAVAAVDTAVGFFVAVRTTRNVGDAVGAGDVDSFCVVAVAETGGSEVAVVEGEATSDEVGAVVDVCVGFGVGVGRSVRVAGARDVSEKTGTGVGGRIWFAMGRPNRPAAIVIASSTNDTTSHC
jgi:hypothetical protein